MKDWLEFSLCALVAVWVFIATIRALLRFRSRPSPPPDRPAVPTGQGYRALARLLAGTGTSTYARDRLQERLRILATDLSALERDGTDPDSRDFVQESEILAAYFAEDHVGFRSSAQRKHALDPEFLRRTEEVIHELEHHGHILQGDRP